MGQDGQRHALFLEICLGHQILGRLGGGFIQAVGGGLGLPGCIGLRQLLHVAAHAVLDALDFLLVESSADCLGDGLDAFGAHGLAPG